MAFGGRCIVYRENACEMNFFLYLCKKIGSEQNHAKSYGRELEATKL